ncbi:MAG TPA: ribonuclease Z [Archaeoglobus profundus]|nr:ribonuclease Z [Archaeoglobus profundus]
MLLKITFLGTSGSVPCVNRNPSAILIQYGGDRILFDCGEGTQRQMMIARTGFNLKGIFITHLHTDHFIGLFGLLETLALNERKEKLPIYVPSPNVKFLDTLFKLFGYYNLSFPVEIVGLEDGNEINFGNYKIVAFKTEHDVPSLGYALIEKDRPGKFNRAKAEELGIPPGPLYAKLVRGESIEINGRIITPDMVVGPPRPGRKIVYTGDTRPCDKIVEIAKDADVLIHDASFTSDLQEWAEKTKHSTAKEAAEIAKKAGVRQLILTHISARYSKDVTPLLEEAKQIFDNVVIAEDLMSIEVRYRD